MLDFSFDKKDYQIEFEFSKYRISPKIHNQTLVRRIDDTPYYNSEIVEFVKNIDPVITEYYNVTLHNKNSNKSKIIKEKALVAPTLLSNHTRSYHHFLIDLVGKILYIKKYGINNAEIKIVIDNKIYKTKELFIEKEVKSFHKEIFNILNLGDYESYLFDISKEESVFFDKVIVAESTTGNMDNFYTTLKLIRDKFVSTYSYENKIYVSRKNAITLNDNGRRIQDEDILKSYYQNQGYRIVYFEEMTFKEQVDLVSSCSDIVSYNGSSMVNTLFAPEGCKITEIRNSKHQQHDSYYFWSKWFNKEHVIVKCFGANTSDEIIRAIENTYNNL